MIGLSTMSIQSTLSSTMSIKSTLRLLEVLLHLFAFFFPEQAQVQDNASFDFIIAGGGSAGCVLASRLSSNANVSVLLIEAGDNPTLEVMLPGLVAYTPFSNFDWNYTTVNESSSFQCYQGDVYRAARGHGLGGSSSINYMIYVRGDPSDYDRWAEISNSTIWSYDNVLPYFKKSEKMEIPHILNSTYKSFHGTKGPMGVTTYLDPNKFKYLEALKEVGYNIVLDTNGNNTLGFNFAMYTIAEGFRQSTSFSFLSPVKNRTNLYVLRNTKVTKILLNGNVATGVQVRTADNETLTFKAHLEVILSAGAFNTPQLLMLSGIGPQDHLQSLNITVVKNLPVGHNLQDHICVMIVHKTDTYNATDSPLNPYESKEKHLNGFLALNSSQKYPDAQVTIVTTRTAPTIINIFRTFDSDIYANSQNIGIERDVVVTFISKVVPLSRGQVKLNSTDPNDPPKIYLGAFTNQTDVKDTILYIKDFLRIENSTYFKSVNAQRVDLSGDRCSSFTTDSDEYWECYSRCLMFSIYHYSCTCPMGTVVDSRLRVYGISKLRVVDASVFPVIPSGNLNAPTIMTAEVAADLIKEDYNITDT